MGFLAFFVTFAASVAYLVPWGERSAVQLLSLALRDGLKVKSSDEAFVTAGRSFPAGTLIIKSSQPHRRLLHGMLAFDPHMSLEALTEERKRLERAIRAIVTDETVDPNRVRTTLPETRGAQPLFQ